VNGACATTALETTLPIYKNKEFLLKAPAGIDRDVDDVGLLSRSAL
tara:strand:+ start:787 stop:924 length:138 start_codon:yes stop_codon:yes gene_type:complete